jgi:hypothetical protein
VFPSEPRRIALLFALFRLLAIASSWRLVTEYQSLPSLCANDLKRRTRCLNPRLTAFLFARFRLRAIALSVGFVTEISGASGRQIGAANETV